MDGGWRNDVSIQTWGWGVDGETPRNEEVDIYVDFLASVKPDHRQVSVSVGSLSSLWRDDKTKVAKIEL